MVYVSVYQTRAFATMAHRHQVRRGWEDYVEHPLRVEEIVRSISPDPRVWKAALLHDVVEDCGVELDQIREMHGIEVALWVGQLTAEEGLSSEMKVARAFKYIETAIVKFADSIDNARLRPLDNWPGMDDAVARYRKNARILGQYVAEQMPHTLFRINILLEEVGCEPIHI